VDLSWEIAFAFTAYAVPFHVDSSSLHRGRISAGIKSCMSAADQETNRPRYQGSAVGAARYAAGVRGKDDPDGLITIHC
jgi:hypothetical protein